MILLGYLVTLIMYSDFRPPRENEDTLFCKETKKEGMKNARPNKIFPIKFASRCNLFCQLSFSKILISINANDN